ncbi:MAG: triose-phosphate isomerase family protein [Spirochaetales bacterium]|jgi:triosephosphate isomerase
MNYIFLNLKRFDIQPEHGGINTLAPMTTWGSTIAAALNEGLKSRASLVRDCSFAAFFPEAHLLAATEATPHSGLMRIGCQSVHHADTAKGGNFGAFTSLRTANAAKELGCSWTLIGHSEERAYKAELMRLAGADQESIAKATNELLNREIQCATRADLSVVYCIGEKAEELPYRMNVLEKQIKEGLTGIDLSKIVLAYEPIWAIGPGKTPPTAEQIASIAAEIKKIAPCPLVYGGGLKKENAASIGAIADLDGGLIALTRFSGAIGFYPDEYLEIVDTYFQSRSAAGGKA